MTRRISGLVIAICILALLLTGCEMSGDDDKGSNEGYLKNIQIIPADASIAKGTGVQFTATGFYSDKTTKDLTNLAKWSVSSATVAVINSKGKATAVDTGKTTVSAQFGSITGTATLEVHNKELHSIEVTPVNPTIAKNTKVQLKATGTYIDPETNEVTFQDLTDHVSWTSSDTATASVGATGEVTGLSGGKSTVAATLSGVSGSTEVTVSDTELIGIQVTPADAKVAKNAKVHFTATGNFSDGSTQDITKEVTWSTGDSKIATIDSTGAATGVAIGKTVVSAEKGGVTGNTSLEVDDSTLMSIDVTPADGVVYIKGTLQYKAEGNYSDGSKRNLTKQAHWTVNPLNIATVDSNGLATGVAAGNVFVTATLNGITGSAPLTVKVHSNDLPDPPKNDAKYFQVMIDSRVGAKRVVHITVVGNRMLLTSPQIYDVTWLTGGGKNFDDWSAPVFQIVNSTTGNSITGANFNNTFSVTLDKLPLDSTGKYHVLKIPYRDPSDGTYSLGGSGRIYFHLDTAGWFQIDPNKNAPNGYFISQPSETNMSAGANNRYDKFEYNCATPDVPKNSGNHVCFINATNVDFFSLGMTYKGRRSGGEIALLGLDLSKPDAMKGTIASLKGMKGQYQKCILTNSTTGAFLRFLAPQLGFTATATELDVPITSGFNYYKTTPLKFLVGTQAFEATSTGSALNFTKPSVFTINKPTSYDVFAATGALAPTGIVDNDNAGKYVLAYLNRGVFNDTSLWYSTAKWYPASVAHNEYADVLRSNFINKVCYAISYDDVPGENVSTAPTIGDCTSMTLVISEE